MSGTHTSILGGKFESAVIRGLDEINNPKRNETTHPYYLGLNRNSEKVFLDRAATFLTIFEDTIIPIADWDAGEGLQGGLPASRLGIQFSSGGSEGAYHEWHSDIVELAELVLHSGLLSDELATYIGQFDGAAFRDPQILDPEKRDQIRQKVSLHYLCRLILQVIETGPDKFLILDENDIWLIEVIGRVIGSREEPLPFPFPEVRARAIFGLNFCGGLLNFSPNDARSIAAIKEDNKIQRYAAKVRDHLPELSTEEGERELLNAMRQAYRDSARLKASLSVFEARSWISKPVSYVPGIGNVVSAANDLIDVGQKAVEVALDRTEWHLIAAHAQQINIEEYLHRKANVG